MAVGDITLSLLTKLGIRMEDEDENTFEKPDKLKALNDTSMELVGLVDNAYLTELEELSSKQACTLSGGRIYQAFTTISGGNDNNVLGKLGITGVTVYDNGASSGVIAEEYKTLKETQDEANSLKAGSATRPKYFVHGEKVYIYTTTKTAATYVEVWYLRKPVTVSTSVDPLIGDHLFNIWLDLAEAQLWKQDHKSDRAKAAYDLALLKIKTLNEKAQ